MVSSSWELTERRGRGAAVRQVRGDIFTGPGVVPRRTLPGGDAEMPCWACSSEPELFLDWSRRAAKLEGLRTGAPSKPIQTGFSTRMRKGTRAVLSGSEPGRVRLGTCLRLPTA